MRDRGCLLALTDVEVVIEGVLLKVQGIGVVQERNGTVTCKAPRFRRPDGRFLPALALPQKLAAAIATEVLAVFNQTADGSPAR